MLKDELMKSLIVFSFSIFLFSGCSATWSGIQEDSSNAWQWTKGQVNGGASYVKEKTE
jgi:hypothetical protein